ncbi:MULTISPECIES: RNA-binding S4 domain-containing protein [Microbulbifer]|uniref:RNA-binding S4 domain-containing protein n=1 Tax=Microbulbifer TaxID=48073 RepID=UPI001E467F86|nr:MULTISPECIES: RNA-binding S4 domain-containing protein [Microbulbifer]UHQ53794.1 RNA-binding S4 domain-containing protein [Microbulbifer sp. YPW16]
MDKVRIDKWLWAARFYKTRSLAKQMIEGGKVQVDGQRIKASKEITTGATLTLRQGWDQLEVEVLALSDQRRGAEVARELYRETEASQARREREAAERKVANTGIRSERPNKKQRRQIHRFLREQD